MLPEVMNPIIKSVSYKKIQEAVLWFVKNPKIGVT
jgi:hypothetical protein